jgi:N-acetylmuramate 1-kinase
MTNRPATIETFLTRSGWSAARRSPIAADASFRRYDRLVLNGKTAILMDAPPEHEDVRPFVAIAGFLRQLGLSAPRIIHQHLGAGLLLLEDLGEQSFNRAIEVAPQSEVGLYRSAIEVLVHLLGAPPSPSLAISGNERYHLPRYTNELLFDELMLFPQWYMAEIGTNIEGAGDELRAIFEPLLSRLGAPTALVLRDYHADNLMVMEGRDGPTDSDLARVGLLDFQDAVWGHPAYDVVSLLDDARRHITPRLKTTMINHYLERAGKAGFDFDADDFIEAYNILGAQRNAKIIGIFTRLWRRDKKPTYLSLIPRVWRLLEANLAHPAMNQAEAWFNQRVPNRLRHNIPDHTLRQKDSGQ